MFEFRIQVDSKKYTTDFDMNSSNYKETFIYFYLKNIKNYLKFDVIDIRHSLEKEIFNVSYQKNLAEKNYLKNGLSLKA